MTSHEQELQKDIQKMEQQIVEIDNELAPHREAMHAASRQGIERGDYSQSVLLDHYKAEMNHFLRVIEPLLAEHVRDPFRNERTFELFIGFVTGFAATIQQDDFLEQASDAVCEWILNSSAESMLDLCLHQWLAVLARGSVSRAEIKDYRGLLGDQRCQELVMFSAALTDCKTDQEREEANRQTYEIRDMRLSRLLGSPLSQWWSLEWLETMAFALRQSNEVLKGESKSAWLGNRTPPKKRGWFS